MIFFYNFFLQPSDKDWKMLVQSPVNWMVKVGNCCGGEVDAAPSNCCGVEVNPALSNCCGGEVDLALSYCYGVCGESSIVHLMWR